MDCRRKSKARLAAASACAALALAACAARNVQPVAAASPASKVPTRTWQDPAIGAARRSLEQAGTPYAAALTPSDVYAAILAYHPQLRLLRAQVDSARAGVSQARQRRNPILSLAPERVISASLGASPWVAALALAWPVQTAGKRALAIEQALAASDSTLLSAAGNLWSLRLLARSTLCLAESAQSRLALAQEDLSLRRDLAGRLQKQADAGLASRYDAARARLDRDAAAIRVARTASNLLDAQHDLAALTSLSLAQIQSRSLGMACLDARPRAGGIDAADLTEAAVASRLDLRAKLAEFRAVDAAWRAEQARRYPDLSLGPGYTFDRGDRKVTFNFSAELPLYSQNQAGMARADAERRRVAAEFEVLQQTVSAAVVKSLDQLDAALQQLDRLTAAVSESQALVDRDAARQAAGEIDQVAVQLTRLVTLSARADRAAATQAVQDAVAALEAATQTPLVAPFFDAAAAIKRVEHDSAAQGSP